MSNLEIVLAEPSASFKPGTAVEGTARWQLESRPSEVEVRLFWFTSGKGDRDVEIVDKLAFQSAASSEDRSFRFTLPQAPYSFSGKLVSLIWAIELVVKPGNKTARVEITVAPEGREIELYGV